ncbi:MAG: antibiotic biosynthesis monooxygenase [Candidatus Thiodiazotropha lotti]|uniref:Antibiotic biosynthesis monooxygenase n=1 Tax=Candidatus Thiodiazotropha lotti TaxID=2792787 RepID=A0A9E4K3R7_9GAMM|nr:antibiotic biosynthesis monooxygenase [Candidatus Thiodiazotropha lotti]ODC00107.1 antibiotic biosynthesis monooxygenase [Candidatus Thiodiazotropha endoloripes]MCG7931723.1 antibiotic biosynthesis monooxygenase [Candidatus Thiodiazotropha lotti]MCG7939102.1 antibiotic biosynthesis monooxygenase [Candidatus Thiodiazotropha lotti]MCW4203576.1 antibiotic biosynthesis monooxygenase [Candidatus Thiodiazotropha lotti]
MKKRVIIKSKVKEGVVDRLMPFLEHNLSNVRGFSGCLKVGVLFDSESGSMIFDEEWLSLERHRSYLDSIANNGVMDELISYLESPPEVNYYDLLDL